MTHVLMLLENSYFPQDPRVGREARALQEAGYRVSVICPTLPGQPSNENIAGIRVLRYPTPARGKGLLGYVWEYGYAMSATLTRSIELFARDRFDVIHAANPPDTFVFIAALFRPFGVKFIFDHHDLAPEMYDARSGFRGNRLVHKALLLLERASYVLSDHVIVTNESYRKVGMDRDGARPGQISVVRNGPDLSILREVEPRDGVRATGKTIIGYAGVMGPQDGVDYLLRTIHHLVHDLGRTDVRCVLMGAGQALSGLRKLADDLGLGDYVEFTGWVQQDDMASYLSATDICIAPEPSNPYNDRSTAVKLMEYMAMAKPIVAFDLPEHRYTAQDAAIYVRPNDELEMARQVALLMDDPKRRQEMGAFGRRRVELELAWPNSVPGLLHAYSQMLHDGHHESVPALRPAEVGEEDVAA